MQSSSTSTNTLLLTLLHATRFQVSLMNFVFLVFWTFALPYPRLRPLAFNVSSVWACVMVVCKMMYQLKSIKPSEYSSNCTAVSIIYVTADLGTSFYCYISNAFAILTHTHTDTVWQQSVLLHFHNEPKHGNV